MNSHYLEYYILEATAEVLVDMPTPGFGFELLEEHSRIPLSQCL